MRVLLGLFLSISAAPAAVLPGFGLEPEREVLARMLGARAAQFELGRIAAAAGRERFRISTANGRIKVDGSTPSAVLFGVNWYLKYVAHVQISTNGNRLGDARSAAAAGRNHRAGNTATAIRYAFNQNIDGYTAPYWSWPRWEHEIDVLALSGINAMIVERGMDAVLYRTFRVGRILGRRDPRLDHAARASELAADGQSMLLQRPDQQLAAAQARSLGAANRRAAARAWHHPRASGLLRHRARPIFRRDFRARTSSRRVNGPASPGPAGSTRAIRCLRSWRPPSTGYQREMFGDSSIYDMEVFQEGGNSGDVPVPEAARDVQNALLAAHPMRAG